MNMLASRQEDQFSKVQSAVITTLSHVLREQILNLPRWPQSIEQTIQQLHQDMIAVAASTHQPLKQHTLQAANTIPPQPQQNDLLSFTEIYAKDCALKLAESEARSWQSLSYEIIDDREDQIAETELDTFEWILQPAQDTQRPWSNFIQWLESDGSIYWICGKAGSGKSTMMKFLNSHPRVRDSLSAWSVKANLPLVTASFYFWHKGIALQKTQQGLLRSLLYQALRNHRELIPVVLKGSFGIFTKNLDNHMDHWTLSRLKAAFHRLLAQTEVPIRICLLVDGLDEYAGNHSDIIEIFQGAAKFDHVKICVSSRPMVAFDRAFKSAPGLMLQNLTFADIQLYVENSFHNDERFRELEMEEPGLGLEMARQVVSKASGVFL
jgi:hypothetical protein